MYNNNGHIVFTTVGNIVAGKGQGSRS